MKIRADIAQLIRAGHTNASIARRLHCAPSTVARARQALRMPPADALHRLYNEAIPTGRVKTPTGPLPLSPAQQAANRERLMNALRNAA
ncbi:helix-turn-helix domain-containing protein [Streptomyces spinosus]|uniref:helix-turn-helix domain-containing protein n=1 Tax=Streptomyces spinosus TaxID=2872623 RepID=UPI001CEC6043|nr:helix-turn-helix domain-containing protein [Streptomyces spinosus]